MSLSSFSDQHRRITKNDQFLLSLPLQLVELGTADMREIELRHAKANLSRVVDDAVRGEPTVISHHGRRQAVIVGYNEWERLSRVPSFGRLLMSAPMDEADLPERDDTPFQNANL